MKIKRSVAFALISLSGMLLASCSSYMGGDMAPEMPNHPAMAGPPPDYAARLPQQLTVGEKVVLVDPRVHAWGAYDAEGNLVHSGLATAGSNWCADLGRPCRTKVGSFRIFSLGSPECKSSRFPIPRGGAPMPYCMFFNGNEALHGSPRGEVVEANISHGCVRMEVEDAEWLRNQFASIGTKVVVRPY